MTVEDKNCFHCNNHYVTGDDMTVEDSELCPSCENLGMLLDCPLCEAPYYQSYDSQVEMCRCCYVRQTEGIQKADVVFVFGQGRLKLDAFGETTIDMYSSKKELMNSMKGLRDVLLSQDTMHVDIIIDTTHPIGRLNSLYIEETFHANRLIEGLYNIAYNAYEEITNK